MQVTGCITLIYLIESLKTNIVICNIYTLLDKTEAIENINRQPDIQSILRRIFLHKNDSLRSKRRLNERKFNNYEELSNSFDATKFKQWLRQDVPGNVEEKNVGDRDELAGLVENELLNALAKKSSALLDKPYIQKQGRNDFLVIKSDITDPFLSIVPNEMYYNVEKKCVNWLDDCNQKGLRERLLQKVNSPYK